MFLDKLDDYLVRFLAFFNYKNYTKEMNLEGNEKILEIGSRGGNMSRFLAKNLSSGELTIVEVSRYWINEVRKKLRNFKNVKYVNKNIFDFEKNNYFDIIIISYVFRYIHIKNRAILLNTLKKNLKENGEIYIRETTRRNGGIPKEEIENLMNHGRFFRIYSKEGYSFPLRGKVYEGVFKIKP